MAKAATNTGAASVMSCQSTLVSAPVINTATYSSAPAVAKAGTDNAKGEINRGGATFMREQAKANRKGALKGFPDLIVLPYANIGPLFIEVKAEGNYADKTQKEVHAKLEALGYRVAVVRSIDDVKDRLTAWGVWAKP
jgi:hypothetical protein